MRVSLSKKDWEDLHGKSNIITASSVMAAVGLDPDRSAYETWARMLGLTDGPTENWDMELGHRMEPVIAGILQDRSGRLLDDPGDYAMWFHPEFPWLAATPDRTYIKDGDCKECPAELKHSRWGFLEPLWDDDADEMPVHAYGQNQVQQECMQAPEGTVCGLIGGNPHIRVRDRDDAFLDELMPALERFRRCLETREEPEETFDRASMRRIWRRIHPKDSGEEIRLDPEVYLPIIREWQAANEDEKSAYDRKESAKFALERAIGDASFAIVGQEILTYKWQRSKNAHLVVEPEHAGVLDAAGVPYEEKHEKTCRVLRIKKGKRK